MCARTADGALWCAGSWPGLLGNISLPGTTTPAQVLDFDGSTDSTSTFDAHRNRVCAVRDSDGATLCWGGNAAVGDGRYMSPSPVLIDMP